MQGKDILKMIPTSLNLKKVFKLKYLIFIAIILLLFLVGFFSYMRWLNLQDLRKKEAVQESMRLKIKGKLYLKKGYFEDAIATLKESLKKNSAGDTYYLLGRAYLSLGKVRNAIPYLEKTGDNNSQSGEYHLTLGMAYIEINENQKAIAELNKAMSQIPLFGVRFHLAQALLEAGDMTKALDESYRLIQISSNPHGRLSKEYTNIFYFSLADLFLKKGDKKEAIKILHLAINNRSSDSQIISFLELLVKSGKKAPETKELTAETARLINFFSTITAPEKSELVTANRYEIKGTTTSLVDRIKKVEVSTDGGDTWQEATTKDDFRHWTLLWLTPSLDENVEIKSRAYNEAGEREENDSSVRIRFSNPKLTVFFSPNETYHDYQEGSISKNTTIYLIPLKSSTITYYRWNNSAYQVYTEAFLPPKRGQNILYYFARDQNGDTGKEKRQVIIVK